MDLTINKTATNTVEFDDNTLLPVLVGQHNENLKILEDALDLAIEVRGNKIALSGQEEYVHQGQEILNALWDRLQNEKNVTSQDVRAALRFYKPPENLINGPGHSLKDYVDPKAVIQLHKKKVMARSPNQAEYIRAMKDYDMVFATGPGGTGKTYLAVAMAVYLYQEKEIDKMIFCRPAVEAGERLGFLPGDMQEKIDPYLRPIYDALNDILSSKEVAKLIEDGRIEIAPLAFMRGRTLKNAFVVLDEAQNTTSSQMKMFLTRMGENAHMIINGDISQIDLPKDTVSGLIEADRITRNINEIGKISFQSADVIRHSLVSKIVDAYEYYDPKPAT